MAKTIAERADVVPLLAEVFREYGFDGASLSVIGERTGLGKGSLYHFFPGGKEEMAAAVLQEIDRWFEAEIYKPLREATDPRAAIDGMLRAVDDYFRSGRRICLVGAFALDNVRDRFAAAVKGYFAEWRSALASALERAGCSPDLAHALAEETVVAIQGALVLARALDDTAVFARSIEATRAKLAAAIDHKH
ncbi:TetR/AcrR family transcriptional regulator [Pleomorphomonas oryzae]|uniref:TetR/AcrR family transcriptional regulator n=1 Tax=Pleomorphomonas oryzae TaxID=261934 RepID=UPI0004162450|nr:TetR/AcrR family transcriptional regulator [Pleomorphomonas oryzae]